MNESVIYKYPSVSLVDALGQEDGKQNKKLIETAIYLPSDSTAPQVGGYSIYLRQASYRELLQEHTGLEADKTREVTERDVAILKVLDSIPSLDPFLMKGAFSAANIEVNEAFLEVLPEEEASIRDIISEKISPILRKALSSEKISTTSVNRVLESIWNPSLPEATAFIKSFGIAPEDSKKTFSALKGIAFYQYQHSVGVENLRSVADWFRSDWSIPSDRSRQPRPMLDQLEMFKRSVLNMLRDTTMRMSSVFHEYDRCLEEFTSHNNPQPLRAYLLKADAQYWLLGHCMMAVGHCYEIMVSVAGPAIKVPLNLESINGMLSRMQSTLRSHVDKSEETAA